MPEPSLFLGQASTALRSGGYFGTLVPTTNQISRILDRISAYPFGLIEVEELMLRGYKTVAQRLRPLDRMIGHTGYLLFARKFERAIIEEEPRDRRSKAVDTESAEVALDDATPDAPELNDAEA